MGTLNCSTVTGTLPKSSILILNLDSTVFNCLQKLGHILTSNCYIRQKSINSKLQQNE